MVVEEKKPLGHLRPGNIQPLEPLHRIHGPIINRLLAFDGHPVLLVDGILGQIALL